jgi:hypothetical protein
MDDAKKIYREGEQKVKKAVRGADGEETVADKVGNAGDEARKQAGNAGDAIRKGADQAQDKPHK